MNKEQELRKLIWKYFWKRKREEVWGFIKAATPFALLLVFMLSVILSFIYIIYIAIEEPIPSFIFYSGPCIFLPITIGFLLLILIDWLRDNWKLATKDARRELNRRRNKR